MVIIGIEQMFARSELAAGTLTFRFLGLFSIRFTGSSGIWLRIRVD